jgi:hypothetical protein
MVRTATRAAARFMPAPIVENVAEILVLLFICLSPSSVSLSGLAPAVELGVRFRLVPCCILRRRRRKLFRNL